MVSSYFSKCRIFSYRHPQWKIHDPPVKWLILYFISIDRWNAFICVSEHHINIQGELSKSGMIKDPYIFLKLLEVSLKRTCTWMMNGFYILSWSRTPDVLSCKRSLNSKLSCRSNKFHRKSTYIWNKKI